MEGGDSAGLSDQPAQPQGVLFCSVLLPQFIHPAQGAVGEQFALLGLVLVVMGMMFDGVYALAGGGSGANWSSARWRRKVQQWVFGGAAGGVCGSVGLGAAGVRGGRLGRDPAGAKSMK